MGLLDPFPTQLCNSAKTSRLLGVVEFQTVKGLNYCVPDTHTDWRILLTEIHSRYKFKDREGIRDKLMTKRNKGKSVTTNLKNHDFYWSLFGVSVSVTRGLGFSRIKIAVFMIIEKDVQVKETWSLVSYRFHVRVLTLWPWKWTFKQ